MMQLLKLVLLLVYVLVPISFVVEALQPWSQTLVIVVAVLMVAHIGEYLLLKNRLAKINNGKNHFVQTLLYGFLYWKPLLKMDS